jgi:pectinesterase
MIDRRHMIIGGVAAGMIGGSGHGATRYDAVVAPVERRDVPAGRRFRDLGAALAAATDRMNGYRIWLARGDWRGQYAIDVAGMTLVGEDRQHTRIAHTAASGMIAADGKPYGTYRTATMTVSAPRFTARNLTIANDFDGIAEMRKTGARLLSDDPAGPQAVALRLAAGSDAARLDAVDIVSHQDAFFPDAGRVTLRGCMISGSYDFIFGAGTAVFDRCEIRSRLRPDPRQITGYIAAPSTLRAQPIGLVFDRCRLTRDAGVTAGSVFLARPWRPSKRFADGQYGNPDAVGMAAYLDCWMDTHIAPAGWTEMWYTDRSGNPRHMLQPEDGRFGEYGSHGPGSSARRRLPVLTAEQAAQIRRLAAG